MRKQDRIIQSHRGAGRLAPENTLESFLLAWDIGTIPEADVRATLDGVPVAFHDANFDRLVKDVLESLRGLGVKDLTWQEVSALDVGSGMGSNFSSQRIPTIKSVFSAMTGRPERRLYLDIKEVPLEMLAELAREHGVDRQVILASTNYDLIRQWKELAPESMTLLWMGENEDRLRQRMNDLRAARFESITQLQIHVRFGDADVEDPFIPSSDFLREVGLEIIPKGILFQVLLRGRERVDIYHRLMDLGVHSFATDDPTMALEVFAGL